MAEPLSQFNDDLAELVMAALWSRAPPASIAAALVSASLSVIAGAGLDFDSFLTNLEAMVTKINDCQQGHLH